MTCRSEMNDTRSRAVVASLNLGTVSHLYPVVKGRVRFVPPRPPYALRVVAAVKAVLTGELPVRRLAQLAPGAERKT
ncbi:hypothetical protein INR49_001204 [Caranx melampygus]|nr:hypothetical protein INR49_001204 [Caranx melampygus]